MIAPNSMNGVIPSGFRTAVDYLSETYQDVLTCVDEPLYYLLSRSLKANLEAAKRGLECPIVESPDLLQSFGLTHVKCYPEDFLKEIFPPIFQ